MEIPLTTAEPGQNQDSFRPRAQRAEVSLVCEVRQGTRPWTKVRLHDISETGFSIEWRPGFTVGQQLYLRVPGLDLITAHLRRKVEDMIGCEFNTRLYGPVYDHIVRCAQSQS